MSSPIAPCTSTAIPRGRDSSNETETSNSPVIGGLSGDLITIFGRRGIALSSEASNSEGPNKLSVADEKLGLSETLTGILRGILVPMHELETRISWQDERWCHLIT
jgi:hypothetical protein